MPERGGEGVSERRGEGCGEGTGSQGVVVQGVGDGAVNAPQHLSGCSRVSLCKGCSNKCARPTQSRWSPLVRCRQKGCVANLP